MFHTWYKNQRTSVQYCTIRACLADCSCWFVWLYSIAGITNLFAQVVKSFYHCRDQHRTNGAQAQQRIFILSLVYEYCFCYFWRSHVDHAGGAADEDHVVVGRLRQVGFDQGGADVSGLARPGALGLLVHLKTYDSHEEREHPKQKTTTMMTETIS